MNTSYSIPETAKLTGIPEHAIREYAKQFADVLPVPEANSESGRSPVKRYPDAALEIFRSIRKLKDEGLDTAEIRTALYAQVPPPTAEYVTEAEYGYTDTFEEESADPSSEAMTASPGEEAIEAMPEGSYETSLPVETEADSQQAWTNETETTGEETMTGEIEATTEVTASPEIEAGAEAEWSAETTWEGAEGTSGTEIEAATTEIGEATEALEETVTADSVIVEPVTALEAPTEATEAATFHPLFTHLDDGLRQLRKIMDENTEERELLSTEREKLLAETASQQEQITSLTVTVASQAEKIGSLQSALSVLMSQCDQQLHAIRNALGQS